MFQIDKIYMSKNEKMGMNLFADLFNNKSVKSMSPQMIVLSSATLGVMAPRCKCFYQETEKNSHLNFKLWLLPFYFGIFLLRDQ